MRLLYGAAFLAVLLTSGCKRQADPAEIERLSGRFVQDSLRRFPTLATAAGFHDTQPPSLDDIWPDFRPAGIAATRDFYKLYRGRLNNLDTSALDAGDLADIDLISSQVGLGELEFDTVQSYRHNPTAAVETVGNGLFGLFTALPENDRYSAILARLRALPAFLKQRQEQLVDTPAIWKQVALDENLGNIALVDRTLREACPAKFRADYDRDAKPALEALQRFSEFLKTLKETAPETWRMNADTYHRKFSLVLGSNVTPEQVLADAEAELKSVRRQMFDLALPLHKTFYPAHRDPVDLNLIVGEVLDVLAKRHVPENDYFPEAQRTLEEARTLIQAHPFVSLPGPDVVKLIETPVFMRGVYGVGGFNPAPVLRPERGAFYWLTPIPREWPAPRKDSKLREYNQYGLRILTLHEAIPGHYLQSEWAARVQPEDRRILRALYGSGVYVEGWAVYASEQALENGYLDRSPELRLTFLKQQLRAIANAILDIRLHLHGMTDEQAMDLMLKQTFQEREEAVAKLQRAKLDSCQLPTYFVGYREFVKLRKATKLEPAEFHRRVLSAGAVPMSSLSALLAASKP